MTFRTRIAAFMKHEKEVWHEFRRKGLGAHQRVRDSQDFLRRSNTEIILIGCRMLGLDVNDNQPTEKQRALVNENFRDLCDRGIHEELQKTSIHQEGVDKGYIGYLGL
jgi:hypothetical protein